MVTAKAFGMKVTRVLRRLRADALVVPARRDRVRRQGDPARRLRQDRRDDAAGRRRRRRGRAAGDVALPGVEADDRDGRRLDHPLHARASSTLWVAFVSSACPTRPSRRRRPGVDPHRAVPLRPVTVPVDEDADRRAAGRRPGEPGRGRRAADRRRDHRGGDDRGRPRYARAERPRSGPPKAGPSHLRRTCATAPTATATVTPGRALSAPPLDDRDRRRGQTQVAGGRHRLGPRRASSPASRTARSTAIRGDRPTTAGALVRRHVQPRSSSSRRRSRRCGTRSPAASATRTPRSAWSAPAGSAARLFERGVPAACSCCSSRLNFFIGIFNLLPLLPLDGGHIAIAWFERVRSWIYARLRQARPGPGRLLQADAAHVRGHPDLRRRSPCSPSPPTSSTRSQLFKLSVMLAL